MSEQEVNLVQLLAWAYLRNARPHKAVALLAALDAVAPGRRGVLHALALGLVRSEQPQQALDTLERATAFAPADAAWHLLRAQALVASGRRIEARAAMTACLEARA